MIPEAQIVNVLWPQNRNKPPKTNSHVYEVYPASSIDELFLIRPVNEVHTLTLTDCSNLRLNIQPPSKASDVDVNLTITV